MKRFLAITLCAVLILAALTGCAEPTDSETMPTGEQTPTVETPADTTTEQTESEEISDVEMTEYDTVEEEIEETEVESEEIEIGQEEQEAKPTEQETVQEPTAFELDDIIGVWHIDESELAALRDTFPGIEDSGTSMEIKSDGSISWYVGTNSVTGTFKASGSGLTADVTDDNDSTKMTVDMTYTDEGLIKMTFRDTEIIWTYGDGGSPRG